MPPARTVGSISDDLYYEGLESLVRCIDHIYLLEIVLFGAVFIQWGSTSDVINRRWQLKRYVQGRLVDVPYKLKLALWKNVPRWAQQNGPVWFAASLEIVIEHVCCMVTRKIEWLYGTFTFVCVLIMTET